MANYELVKPIIRPFRLNKREHIIYALEPDTNLYEAIPFFLSRHPDVNDLYGRIEFAGTQNNKSTLIIRSAESWEEVVTDIELLIKACKISQIEKIEIVLIKKMT